MSRPQESQRPFFQFGNPFRMISSKGSDLSPTLRAILNSFEENLAERMRKLIPKDKDDVLSLSWMKLAMVSLCETHNEIKVLITDLELPVCGWDEKWIDMYLDISVKLLDICIAFSSELSRLNHGHFLLQCMLHSLESASSKQFVRASSSLDGWKHHISKKNQRIESCCVILDNLVGTLNLPKVKNSAKGKVLMRAMYGAKVETVFICSVFSSAFSGSANKLKLNVPDTCLWSPAFNALQSNVTGEMQNIISSGRVTVLKELEAVESSVNSLYPMIQEGVGLVDVEAFETNITDLGKRVEKLSKGLDLLGKEVDSFFRIVLTGRDALLCNLQGGDNVSSQMFGNHTKQQTVR